MTRAETFLWYRADSRLRLGLAHLEKQNAFRYLASYQLHPERAHSPSLQVSAGVQGIGTGNPGFSFVAEKNFRAEKVNTNLYVGMGYRSNEDHLHPVAGLKFQGSSGISVGLQWEGHDAHPFLTQSWKQYSFGFFLIRGKSSAFMLGMRY